MSDNKKIIILDGLDFMWSKRDIDRVVSMHNKGHHINEISKNLKRNSAEVLMALIHVAVQGEVGIRPLYKG